ncbi:MAG: cytochrome c oxidase subunit 3 [Halobacteriales archaeon]|nr:cytochrome c oxidase subunit 3 [Halobacteriales archaeon]
MGETDSDRPGEPVRRGEGAEGFPHGSKYPFVVGLGLFFVGWGLMWTPVLLVGVPILVYGLWGWTAEYTITEYEAGVIPEQKRQLLGIETGMLGMYILIVSEILVFAGFFVAWFYLDATRGPFPPDGFPGPQFGLGVAMTAVMIVGSVTIRYGRQAIQRDDRGGLVRGYLGTLMLGITFLAVLGIEYYGLIAGGVLWSTGAYGAAFYGLTGLHALHLGAGLVLVGIVLYRAAARGHFSARRNLMVRTTEAYWYFLTVLSLLIFAFIYFNAT